LRIRVEDVLVSAHVHAAESSFGPVTQSHLIRVGYAGPTAHSLRPKVARVLSAGGP